MLLVACINFNPIEIKEKCVNLGVSQNKYFNRSYLVYSISGKAMGFET